MNYFSKLLEKSKSGIYLIAEACDNHMGSLDIAKGLVDAAKESGADSVKFQHHLADEEMLANTPISSNFNEPLYEFLLRNSLSLDNHFELYEYCKKKKITYLCTPFSFTAAKEIKDLVPFFKIGSGEFQDHWFIDKLKNLNKPILFSSGMCDFNELKKNIEYIKNHNLEFALMNCLSEYPPIHKDMNLGFITTLKNEFPDIVIGHSDHTADINTSIIAMSLGAEIIEKHITLSKFIPGPDNMVSVEPHEMRRLAEVSRYTKELMGSKKIINKKEREIRKWAYRSVVSKKNIKKGSIIKASDIITKRPGTGIPSKDYKKIVGRKSKVNIPKNKLIMFKDLND